MTGREEFARRHPELAAELDRIERPGLIAAVWRDVLATGRIEPELILGGIPITALFGVLVAGMCAWSWSLWLLAPTILLGLAVPACLIEALTWLVGFTVRLATRSARRHGGARSPGGDQR